MTAFDALALRQRIRLALFVRHQRQADLAREIGVARSILSRIMRGNGNPDIETFSKIMIWLGDVDPREFMKGRGE